MALNGFALGGFAQGFNQQQQLQLSQQSADRSYELGQRGLALQEQAQKNADQRAMMARADQARSDMLKLVSDTVTALKQNGTDNATISQKIQPIVQPLKRLTKSSGLDDSNVDAMVATMLARPMTDISSITGGQSGAPQATTAPQATAAPAAPAAPAPQSSSDLPNLSSPGVTMGQPINAPVTPDPQADVNKFTAALARLPADANPNVRMAIQVRLQDAIQRARQNDQVEVKTIKDENGNEHILFVDKRNRSVTDQNGQPYVTPTGGDSDANTIATAIREGRQPPVLTGLYKNSKAVRAALERQGVNLTDMQLEWQRAQAQVRTLNSSQMTRFVSTAGSVLSTIDRVKELSHQMELSGIPILNKAKLQAYIQAAGNSENGQLAARYMAAVNTLKEEFVTVASGGYAPVEAAWDLANQQVNGNYGVKELDASLDEIKRLLSYRVNSIKNLNVLGAGAPNRYIPQQPNAQQPTQSAPSDNGGGWNVQRIQ